MPGYKYLKFASEDTRIACPVLSSLERFILPEEESERRCCRGYIVWKYNDSWPEIYSAKVDYFLESYHVYYTLKRVYAPVILFVRF